MTPEPEPPPVLEALPMLAVLVGHGVEFAVIGGFSLAAHEELEATQRGLEDFRPEELPVQLDLDGLSGGGNLFLTTKFGWLDVMQWVEGIDGYEQLRRSGVRRSLPGVGDAAAGRPQDLVDLERLRESVG